MEWGLFKVDKIMRQVNAKPIGLDSLAPDANRETIIEPPPIPAILERKLQAVQGSEPLGV